MINHYIKYKLRGNMCKEIFIEFYSYLIDIGT